MITTQQINARIYVMADAASIDWFKRQIIDVHSHMYLYYKPGEIAFWIGEEPLNEHWILGWNERISIAKTKEQVREQIIDIAKKLPILN